MKISIVLSGILIGSIAFGAHTSTSVCEQLFHAGNAAARAAAPMGNETCTESEALHPFTHEAQIPANSDLSSTRFDGMKLVRVATEVKLSADPNYCKESSGREPGGSNFCPQVELGTFESAYQVTYSYTGPPLSSDERGGTTFSFSVYFRPDELDEKQRDEISTGKSAAAAEWFELITSRRTQTRLVINEAASTFCPGKYVDGVWTPEDPECQENIAFKIITEPSDYFTVRVEEVRPTRSGGSFKQ